MYAVTLCRATCLHQYSTISSSGDFCFYSGFHSFCIDNSDEARALISAAIGGKGQVGVNFVKNYFQIIKLVLTLQWTHNYNSPENFIPYLPQGLSQHWGCFQRKAELVERKMLGHSRLIPSTQGPVYENKSIKTSGK